MRKVIGTIAAFALPFVALAQNNPDLGGIDSATNQIGNIIDNLIPIIAALALLFFFWGLATFILAAGDEEKRKSGKQMMIWGIVALFVMAAIWGIIQFLGGLFGVQTGGSIDVPTVIN